MRGTRGFAVLTRFFVTLFDGVFRFAAVFCVVLGLSGFGVSECQFDEHGEVVRPGEPDALDVADSVRG